MDAKSLLPRIGHDFAIIFIMGLSDALR